MEYQIINFDRLYNLFTIRFNDPVSGNPSEMILNVPLNKEGNLPEGKDLDSYIQMHLPKTPEIKVAKNADSISNLVIKDPDPVDLLPLGEKMRIIRNAKIGLEEWRIKRYTTQKALGVPTTDTEEQYKQVLQYIEDLRNITSQKGFPENINWPEDPSPSITADTPIVHTGGNTFNIDTSNSSN